MISSSKRKIQKTNRFSKDIKKLPTNVQRSTFDITNKLAINIFDPDLNIKKLTGFEKNFLVIVMKDYRLIFTYDAENLYLLRIGHRKNIYRKHEL